MSGQRPTMVPRPRQLSSLEPSRDRTLEGLEASQATSSSLVVVARVSGGSEPRVHARVRAAGPCGDGCAFKVEVGLEPWTETQRCRSTGARANVCQVGCCVPDDQDRGDSWRRVARACVWPTRRAREPASAVSFWDDPRSTLGQSGVRFLCTCVDGRTVYVLGLATMYTSSYKHGVDCTCSGACCL